MEIINGHLVAEQEPARNVFQNQIFPLLCLGIILVADYLTTTEIITPILLLLVLMLMMNWCPPRLQVFWIVVYTSAVLFVFFGPYFKPHYKLGDGDGIFRSATFIVAAFCTFGICLKRFRMKKSLHSAMDLIRALPLPVIASSHTGKILLANESAAALLGMSCEDLQHHSYYYVFAPPSRQGQLITNYLKFVENPLLDHSGDKKALLELSPVRLPHPIKAQWSTLTFDDTRILITVLLT